MFCLYPTDYENACRNDCVTEADSNKIYDRDIDFRPDRMLCKRKCCYAWLIKSTGKEEGSESSAFSQKTETSKRDRLKSAVIVFVTSDSQVL